MANKFDGRTLLMKVSNCSEPIAQAPSKPVVLGFVVAEALRKAKLADAVLEMRRSPAGWVDFLVQLHMFLEEGAVS